MSAFQGKHAAGTHSKGKADGCPGGVVDAEVEQEAAHGGNDQKGRQWKSL